MVQINLSGQQYLYGTPSQTSAPQQSTPTDKPETPGEDGVWAVVDWATRFANDVKDTFNDTKNWLNSKGIKFGNGGFTYHRGNLSVAWGKIALTQPNVPGVPPLDIAGKGITFTITF